MARLQALVVFPSPGCGLETTIDRGRLRLLKAEWKWRWPERFGHERTALFVGDELDATGGRFRAARQRRQARPDQTGLGEGRGDHAQFRALHQLHSLARHGDQPMRCRPRRAGAVARDDKGHAQQQPEHRTQGRVQQRLRLVVGVLGAEARSTNRMLLVRMPAAMLASFTFCIIAS